MDRLTERGACGKVLKEKQIIKFIIQNKMNKIHIKFEDFVQGHKSISQIGDSLFL
jgi:hypothetical protein